MSLILFPRCAGPANVVRQRPRFQLLDEVRLLGERHVRGVIVATRAPKPWAPEVCVQRDDGAQSWVPEASVMPGAGPAFTVIAGGKP